MLFLQVIHGLLDRVMQLLQLLKIPFAKGSESYHLKAVDGNVHDAVWSSQLLVKSLSLSVT